MFSFQALNVGESARSASIDESFSRLSEDTITNDCSLLSEKSDRSAIPSDPLNYRSTFKADHEGSTDDSCTSLSISIQDLLRPSNKSTREVEEVRVTKLYRHALRLCSAGNSGDELSAKPLLESIMKSFLLKGDKLPSHLSSVKFATCKLLGGIYVRLDRKENALKLFLKAVQLDCDDLSLWIRLVQVAINVGDFHKAHLALDHILSERPSHPIALPMALSFYLAISELETCLDLSVRMLRLDRLNERALYCAKNVLKLQPSLSSMLEDPLFLTSEDISLSIIDPAFSKVMEQEVLQLRKVYREQLDAECDKRTIRHVLFDLPSELTWESLLDSTLKLFDKLKDETLLNSVIEFPALSDAPVQILPGITHYVDTDVNSPTAEAERVSTEKLQSIFMTNQEPSTSNVKCELVPNVINDTEDFEMPNGASIMSSDQNDESNYMEPNEATTVTDQSLDITDSRCDDNNNDQSEDPLDTTEKRRSCRSRPPMDLTDGLNRYRNKRSVEPDTRVTVDKRNSQMSYRPTSGVRSNQPPFSRIQLSGHLKGLLPPVFIDVVRNWLRVDQQLEPTHVKLPDSECTIPEHVQCVSQSIKSDADRQWLPNAIRRFLVEIGSTKPSIITFSIGLLLQVSQLVGRPWSSHLVQVYLALSDRIRPSFPHFLISSNQDVICTSYANSAGDESDSCLLRSSILCLFERPGPEILLRLHVTYVELRLESLEHVLISDIGNGRISGFSSNCFKEDTLTPSTIFTLLDTFSLFEYTSSTYVDVQLHFSWINYLLSSLIRDFSEMRNWLLLILEHLETRGSSMVRNYSFHHGDLSYDYVNQLLNQLIGVTEMERLSGLTKTGDHRKVVTELMLTLRTEAANCAGQLDAGYHSVSQKPSECIRGLERLQLLESSLQQLFHQLFSTGESADVNELGDFSDLYLLYNASTLLMDAANKIAFDCELMISASTDDEQKQIEELLKTVYLLSLNAFQILCRCWLQLPVQIGEIPLPNGCTNIKAISQWKLKSVDFDQGSFDDHSICSNMDDQCPNALTVGHACFAVSTVLQFLALSLRLPARFVPSVSTLFSMQVISFVYEQLACIEQSLPFSVLPAQIAIQRMSLNNIVLDSNHEFMTSLKSRSLSASPSLAWLHLVHETLALLMKDGTSSNYASCRDRSDIRNLLRQLVKRATDQLEMTRHNLIHLQQYNQCTNTDSLALLDTLLGESQSSTTSGDEFVDTTGFDDETVACVDEMQSSSWPTGCPSIYLVLAQSLYCLLPAGLLKEIDSAALSCRGDLYESRSSKLSLTPASDNEEEPVRDASNIKQSNKVSRLLTANSKTLFGYHRVNKLILQNKLCQHSSANSSLGPAWWKAQSTNEEETENEIRLLDWECMKTAFQFCCPINIPEFDSVKTLSISSEMAQLFIETGKLIPIEEEQKLLASTTMDAIMQSRSKGTVGIPTDPSGLSLLSQNLFYLVADHYMKNNNFEPAVDYYLQDLRACPRRADSWAALGLIYYSELEQIINLTNFKTERVQPDAVSRCLRCFAIALYLLPGSITLLIERGCLAYQLHSYASRIVKKSTYRNFAEAHLNICQKWRSRMIHLARASYERVLSFTRPTEFNNFTGVSDRSLDSSGSFTASTMTPDKPGPIVLNESVYSPATARRVNQAKEEEWLCYYMLAKCAEKEVTMSSQTGTLSDNLLPVLFRYRQSLDALDATGAKYPRKIIVYHKLPFRAVEAVEIYYRIHALALKALLQSGPPSSLDKVQLNYQLPLADLLKFLTRLQSSEFVTGAGKSRRSKKRTATSAGCISKPTCVSASKQVCSTDPSTSITLDNKEVFCGSSCTVDPQPSSPHLPRQPSSQDDFIDLTDSSPPPTVHASPVQKDTIQKSSGKTLSQLELWETCVNLCGGALELVLQRLPLHYKAMYRLADMYLRAPHIKDTVKALNMLLGPLDEASKSSTSGLFKDRRPNNFFHGVWRIPTSDIDRSGNFAAHMYRSVYLTLEILHDRGDWRHLVHLFHQLRKQPPEEKRGFLGEGDRVYLAKRAFNLIQPTLYKWLTSLHQNLSATIGTEIFSGAFLSSPHLRDNLEQLIQSAGFLNMETLTQIYRLHCVSYSRNATPGNNIPSPAGTNLSTSSSCDQKRASTLLATEVSGYADVLLLAYRLCPSAWDSNGPHVSLELVLRRCTELTSARCAKTKSNADAPSAPTGTASS